MSEYEDIRDAETIESWQKDDAWERTVQARKARYADEVFAAQNEEAALRVWRKYQVFQDVMSEFDARKGRGHVAKLKKAAAEKQKKG